LTQALPPEPTFGAPLPTPQRSDAVLRFLALRRSASAGALTAPGPSPDELRDLLRLAARTPDHGKLFPWRFIILEGEAKTTFAGEVEALAAHAADPEKARAALFKLTTPPVCVVVVSRFIEGKIPEWEQRLSAGAVTMTLLHAAQAMGYGANWITDWYAFDASVARLLGLSAGEQIAGFVYLGTAREPALERIRPDVDALVSHWAPG
jgi:nitroreductase